MNRAQRRAQASQARRARRQAERKRGVLAAKAATQLAEILATRDGEADAIQFLRTNRKYLRAEGRIPIVFDAGAVLPVGFVSAMNTLAGRKYAWLVQHYTVDNPQQPGHKRSVVLVTWLRSPKTIKRLADEALQDDPDRAHHDSLPTVSNATTQP